MVEITVKAADSASAMEEVEKRLGSEALIISTNKVDGKIEIVASNDELSKYKKSEETLILDTNYRVKNFSEVLDNKISKRDDQKDKKGSSATDKKMKESLEIITRELTNLSELQEEFKHTDVRKNIVQDKFRLAGFKVSTLDKIGLTGEDLSIADASKIIARKIVHGKCPNFENSNLYIVTGPENSGKTLFTEKLNNFIQNHYPARVIKIFNEVSPKKDYKQIRSWICDRKSKLGDDVHVGIIDCPSEENVEQILIDIANFEPEMKVSIINLMPVGSSYEYLMSNCSPKMLENEYFAITKLDLCDFSMPELSALIELNRKVMLFAGIKSADEGLFFAKVDKIASHIAQTISKVEN